MALPAKRKRSRTAATRFGLAVVLALIALGPTGDEARSQGADQRQLAAHLVILAGDLKRLGDEHLPVVQRSGLNQRIMGLMGGLPWLFRINGDPENADKARQYLGDPVAVTLNSPFNGWLDQMRERYPFSTRVFDPDRVPPTSYPKALAIHQTYCAGCHDGTAEDAEVALPARDLYLMAAEMTVEEFLARLANGVRGDQVTGLANPLTDAQMAALTALYRAGKAE